MATPSHGAQGKVLTTGNSSPSSSAWKFWVVCVPGLSPRREVLGFSWILMVSSDTYSFSSGALSGPMPRELLWLMARSAEQPENGWLSILDTSLPGLLSSSSEPQQSELLSGKSDVPPVAVPVGTGDAGVSFTSLLLLLMVSLVSAGTLLATVLAGILWSGFPLVGTLGGTMPERTELMGNLDGARLVGIAPGGFKLVGNLEGTELPNAELVGTLEGTVLAVIGLLGTPAPLEQMVPSAWSPAPPTEVKPMEEEEVPTDGADTGGPGKRLALGVERAKGWKETVGDTGPWSDVELETTPAVWVLPSSVSCS